MTTRHLMAFTLLASAIALAACGSDSKNLDPDPSGPNTPRGDVPAELAGSWFTGTLSTIQYYDRNTGQWQSPNGSGFYVIIDDDGDYETGAVIDSTVSGCNMRLLGVEVGTVEVSEDVINVHRHWVRTKVTNTCGNDGERTQGEASRVLTWSVDPDESGLEWLTLTHADGATERYHRWNQPE